MHFRLNKQVHIPVIINLGHQLTSDIKIQPIPKRENIPYHFDFTVEILTNNYRRLKIL